ncbi:putative transcriptional regulator YvhJ [Clostridium acetireducens DSM 10703]|jgi:LCP family protein required for cell wall assembly|uniref:Putative transcriptional regulator YvhJ n=1 Tax=Clostridium acetireducens DSM 10703 TaxID=1121290 RepID=A0A1E8F189_9CLOT|nr:LCP family protein [Clostridium acetireducens]OFI07208.1 putative transcriptional regulator YvhJ [Clostridium acetireducens DSM 10703]
MSHKNKNKKFLSPIWILIILIITTASLFYFYLKTFNNKSQVGEGEINTTPIESSSDNVNILLMGVDIGDPKANSNLDPKRTDTIILVNYHPMEKKINIVSIPRDTLIYLKGNRQKINVAHALGGPGYLIDSVQQLIQVPINYYVKLDYKGFREIINSIGGVDIEIKNNMYYDDPAQNLSINFKKGEVAHLDGKKAEEFFRWRKNNDGTGLAEGDIGRIKNQQEFISKVLEKIKSPLIITKIPSILTTIPKYVETNMEPEHIVKYGYAFMKVEKENINMTILKGHTKYINGSSYFIYEKEKNKELIRNLISGYTESFDKEKLNIQVLNGTNKNGLAARYAAKLKEKGYINVFTGNGKNTLNSKIIVCNINKDEISTIKDEFFIKNVEKREFKDEKFDIIVLLGDDFDFSSN